MRTFLIVFAICFSANAFAQDAPPKVGGKPLVQVKPKEPMGCKMVGTVKGTKLWAGDCVGPGLRGAIPSTQTQSVPDHRPERSCPIRKNRAGAEGGRAARRSPVLRRAGTTDKSG